MRRILVPLDGSELAEAALGPALRLAARHGAEVVIVSVVADVAPPVAVAPDATEAIAHWLDEEEKARRAYVDGVRQRVAGQAGGVAISGRVEVGRVAFTLLETAGAVGADLIVSTTHGRGAWSRFWLGSVADQLLRRSSIPLLLLREGDTTERLFASASSPEHVVVPLDGSTASEAVFPALRALFPKGDRRLTLISVAIDAVLPLSPYLPDATWERALVEEEKAHLGRHLERVKESLAGGELGRAEARLVEGPDVPRTLIRTIQESGADLVALSTHGRGRMGRMLMGSVADKVVRGVDLPVLVVPQGEPA